MLPNYRCYSKNYNKYFDIHQINTYADTVTVVEGFNESYQSYELIELHEDDVIMEQYTEWKGHDSNVNPVCEGDIIELSGPYHLSSIVMHGLPAEHYYEGELFVVIQTPVGFELRHIMDYKAHLDSSIKSDTVLKFLPENGVYGNKPVAGKDAWSLQSILKVVGNVNEDLDEYVNKSKVGKGNESN